MSQEVPLEPNQVVTDGPFFRDVISSILSVISGEPVSFEARSFFSALSTLLGSRLIGANSFFSLLAINPGVAVGYGKIFGCPVSQGYHQLFHRGVAVSLSVFFMRSVHLIKRLMCI